MARAAPTSEPPKELTAEDEEAMRARLREAGWDKTKILKAKESAEDKGDDDRKKDRRSDKESRSSRRRSRSARRRDKDRDRRRDRDRDRDRERDRDRGERSSRRSRRSRSASKSRSRSTSAHGSSRRDRERGREKERSRTDRRRSRSPTSSRSPSKSRGSKRSRRSDSKTEASPASKHDEKKRDKDKEQPTNGEATGYVVDKTGDKSEKPMSESNGDNVKELDNGKDSKKDADDKDHKSRKSSRHRSRSTSQSPSRSHRRRHRRRSTSRSRSASRRRRGRGSSRSRSRSYSRRHRSSRRRSSRSRSRSKSRSHSRRHRSKSREHTKRDANSSPQPHQFPPSAADATASALNPSITQLMQQYPTMSLQDIIAKMQASNVTMAAAVSMKPARELYVGNLPASVTGPQLQEFLGTIIQQVGLTVQPGNPILSTWISTDGHFAFCEMRSIEECNMALMLNQLPLLGQPLKFGRPKSFMGPPQPMPVLPPRTQTALANLGCTPNTAWFASHTGAVASVPGMTAALTSAMPTSFMASFSAITLPPGTSSNQLIMSNIPVVLTEDQVKELVEPFGALTSFEFVKDPITLQPTGSALFEYQDASVTDDAKNGLDGLDLGGIPLAVKRAVASEETGPVLRMANMVSIDDLKDDEEFADLKEDVEEECKRFGTVVSLEIPRPVDGQVVPGLGDIFVQFANESEAAAALKALSGRKFGGNIVKVSYFPLAKLQQKDFA